MGFQERICHNLHIMFFGSWIKEKKIGVFTTFRGGDQDRSCENSQLFFFRMNPSLNKNILCLYCQMGVREGVSEQFSLCLFSFSNTGFRGRGLRENGPISTFGHLVLNLLKSFEGNLCSMNKKCNKLFQNS